MSLFAGGLIPWVELRFFKPDGTINAFGTLNTFGASSTTPQVTYTDSDLTIANPVSIVLGVDGRPPNPIYLSAIGYDFQVLDADGVEIYTQRNIQDIGQVFAEQVGYLQTLGAKSQPGGYIVVPSDRLVTMDTTGTTPSPANVSLPAAPAFTGILCIKNVGDVDLAINANGSDTIEGFNSAYGLQASDGTIYPTVILISDGVSNWWVWAAPSTPTPTPSAYDFASLPSSPITGQLAIVSDSNTGVWGDTIAGGGSNFVLAWYNGTGWTVVGN